MWRLAVNFSISQVQTAYHLKCFSASKGGYNLKSGTAPPNINGRSYLSYTFAPATAALNAAIRAFFIINLSILVFHHQFVHFWFFVVNLSILAFFIIKLSILDLARQLQFRANSGPVTDCTKFVKPQTGCQKTSNWLPKKLQAECQNQDKVKCKDFNLLARQNYSLNHPHI